MHILTVKKRVSTVNETVRIVKQVLTALMYTVMPFSFIVVQHSLQI